MRRTRLLVLALLAACAAPRTRLEPAPGARRLAGMEAATEDRVEGVRVITQTTAWPGPTPIQQVVTPIRLIVDNHGRVPLRLRYAEITLVTPDGRLLRALPPLSMEGSVTEPVAVAVSPIASPRFGYRGFYPAPWYGPVYPTLDPWGGPFAWDPWYHSTHVVYWADIPLPSPDMLQLALPEGVLVSGGRVDGWVFFQAVPDDVDRVTLRMDLVDADSGRSIGEVRVPYVVP